MVYIEEILNKVLVEMGKKSAFAIYGTGNAADYILEKIEEKGMLKNLKFILDREEIVKEKGKYHGYEICTLESVYNKVDYIIIASFMWHKEIADRLNAYITSKHLQMKIINIFLLEDNSIEDSLEYVHYLEKRSLKKKENFVPYQEKKFCRRNKDSKIIAWYLPQFHQIEVNNQSHGQGFTEWTNTSQAFPQFVGHYQPHIPYHMGYYDLLNVDTLRRQIDLAQQYGIYGFSFYYYWYSGKKFMERPLQMLLEHKELRFPFCIYWATHNWTLKWDTGKQGVIFEQKIEEKDDIRFMEDILPFLKDERYIKISGKPLLILFKVDLFEKKRVCNMIENFRNYARNEGFEDLYIMISGASYGIGDVKKWGADAFLEVPPMYMEKEFEPVKLGGYVNPYFRGAVFDAAKYLDEKRYLKKHHTDCFFRTAMVSFDNTARRCLKGAMVILNISPKRYKEWIKNIMLESKIIHDEDSDIVFVNAWNEWAEGAHLEPDLEYGYAYLQATYDALIEVRNKM